MATSQNIDVNGVKISYRVEGEGPPLVLIMGYRLSAIAWPAAFIATLKRSFTVVTLDNRGTGHSDKPLTGYALANMARDVAAVLDRNGIGTTYVLGYSMGGAIAQEFVRQFPERVSGLILCATMCGGPLATYAEPAVTRVMRDLDGLSTQQIARRIWQVTYAPGYLEQHRELAEDQMQRETALPTPLHAADLQFQAFAQFDGASALAHIACPTLVLTGDLDKLVPPRNSDVLAKLIPGAKLVVVPGGGHRVLWEAVDDCADLITNFLNAIHGGPVAAAESEAGDSNALSYRDPYSAIVESFFMWPWTTAQAGLASVSLSLRTMLTDNSSIFGDGKPIIIFGPRLFGSDLMLLPTAEWLKTLGYRPAIVGVTFAPDDLSGDMAASRTIRAMTRRVGRKAVLLTHTLEAARALRVVNAQRHLISDVIVFDASKAPDAGDVRTHVISSEWNSNRGLIELPRLLRSLPIELIADTDTGFVQHQIA